MYTTFLQVAHHISPHQVAFALNDLSERELNEWVEEVFQSLEPDTARMLASHMAKWLTNGPSADQSVHQPDESGH